MLVYDYNPSYLGGGGRRIMVPGWPEQKHEILSEKQTKSKKGLRVWLKW
jgi:hypothetical protein